MNRLISHIEFLLHEHNCVIIPGFGGFVVNTVPPRRDGIAAFHAPVCELVFNRDLSHNDGLLAQSYMKSGSVTFESAMQEIGQDVGELKRRLRGQRRLDMGRLGSFAMHDEKRFIYTPGAFIRPALFGLTRAALKPLIQMQPVIPERKRRRGAGIAAAAAAAVALLMFILPVGDTAVRLQSARMISETGWIHPKAAQPIYNAAAAIANGAPAGRMEGRQAAADVMAEPAAGIARNSGEEDAYKYYIVMGVFKKVESAEKITQLLLDEGFNQTGWLERPERIDVYAASFTDKNAAEVYLKEVHKKFPKHTDAWILKK